MENFLEWLFEQRSWIAIGLAIVLFAITLTLRFAFDLWWPWGILMATVLAFVGLFIGAAE